MPRDAYRDRLVHEFDENLDQDEDGYLATVQQEAAAAAGKSYAEFEDDVESLPNHDYEPNAVQDEEAKEAYRKVQSGGDVPSHQAKMLKRVAGTLSEEKVREHGGDNEEAREYLHMATKAREVAGVTELRDELEAVEDRYTVEQED